MPINITLPELNTPLPAPDLPQAEHLSAYRNALDIHNAALQTAFAAGAEAEHLVQGRAAFIDQLLQQLWACLIPAPFCEQLALVAVGGYGRGELHPGSDIDLAILIPDGDTDAYRNALESFFNLLWDIGLAIGHSVRTLDDCYAQAQGDVTVITNLLESRLLSGNHDLFDSMRARITTDQLWPADAFFSAKVTEQQQRHQRNHGTAYRLEPNVKESPGGLRDLQTIGWIAKRHFHSADLEGLVSNGFLNIEEYTQLIVAQHFLWRVRFALHSITKRHEDRLLFDHQPGVAAALGYEDGEHGRAVEAFMQQYYQTITRTQRLNELLLQLFEEKLLNAATDDTPTPINADFQLRRGFLEATDEQLFARRPIALLELFLVLQDHPAAKGVRASTIRAIRKYRDLAQTLGDDPRARKLFIDLFKKGTGLTHTLRRMHRYGILARFFTLFRPLVGRMQFDLFHIYPVDEHILMVVRNLRRIACAEFQHELPLCSDIIRERIAKPHVLYLAGLFHDIGKGRGGDHSELGAVDALEFCLEHGLPRSEASLVAWLVRQHLLMSTTAQRKDISDPTVIHAFAEQVGSEERLDYLFLLTVADIRGTNPELWNNWRASLLTELYHNTLHTLKRGLAQPLDQADFIAEKQAETRHLLRQFNLSKARTNNIWAQFSSDHFLRHTPMELAWHTQAIANHQVDQNTQPLVLVQQLHKHGSNVFIDCPDRDYLFGHITGVLDQLGLTIVDARISLTRDQYVLSSYIILEADNSLITSPAREAQIMQRICAHLNAIIKQQTAPAPLNIDRRISRQLKAFNFASRVSFTQDTHNQRTVLELITADRPGLLSKIGHCFAEHGVLLQNAKIGTYGERAEDVFFITNQTGQAITDPAQQDVLKTALIAALDD